jgi:hypothetical protein
MADIAKTIVQAQAVIDRLVEESWERTLTAGPPVLSLLIRNCRHNLEHIRGLNDERLEALMVMAELGHTVMCHQKMTNSEQD